MIGRSLWILSCSLLLVGCGKKNAEPTNSPDSVADASSADADEAASDEDLTGDVEDEDEDDGGPAAEDTADPRKALLKLKLVRGGKTLEHPGYMVERGEEVTIVMTKGGHTHEIDFLFETGDGGYDVEVVYRDNGRKALEKKASTEKQQWLELKSGKTKLSLFIDPDAGRVDEVEMVGGDDPLGGV